MTVERVPVVVWLSVIKTNKRRLAGRKVGSVRDCRVHGRSRSISQCVHVTDEQPVMWGGQRDVGETLKSFRCVVLRKMKPALSSSLSSTIAVKVLVTL